MYNTEQMTDIACVLPNNELKLASVRDNLTLRGKGAVGDFDKK